jgi:hypothetical protein
MQPEGIVHVLRHLCEALVPGGLVLDLQAIEPSGRVEVDGQAVGRIDDSVFFARARRAVAGLDALAAAGLLRPCRQVEFDTLVRYDAGAELVAAIEAADERRLPAGLAPRLVNAGPCAIRERTLVRVLERPAPALR